MAVPGQGSCDLIMYVHIHIYMTYMYATVPFQDHCSVVVVISVIMVRHTDDIAHATWLCVFFLVFLSIPEHGT